MALLRNKDTGAVVGPMLSDSPQYRAYIEMLSTIDNRPLWEGVSESDAYYQVTVTIPATAAADTATETVVVDPPDTINDELTDTYTVKEVDYYPASTITGAATNNREITVVDTTDSDEALASITFGDGTNASGSQFTELTVDAGTTVTVDDTITVESAPVGTGIADPGGVLVITLMPTAVELGPDV